MYTKLIATAAAAAAIASVSPARADVTGSLTVDYFTATTNNGGDPDFQTGSGNHTSEVTTTLGPDGLPVASMGAGLHDINANGEITWWSPTGSNPGGGNANVTFTSTNTVPLPFSNNSFFPPNGTGTTDQAGKFQTAILMGTFNLSSAASVTFNLASDDDSFIYVDGTLVLQDPGVHGPTSVPATTSMLGAGNHALEVFYADRHTVQATLDFSVVSNIVINPVPEPAGFALLSTGLIGLGLIRRRRG